MILSLLACAIAPLAADAAQKKKGGKKRQIVTYKTQKLTNKFWAEGAHYADFNKDGKTDVVVGPYWYAGRISRNAILNTMLRRIPFR